MQPKQQKCNAIVMPFNTLYHEYRTLSSRLEISEVVRHILLNNRGLQHQREKFSRQKIVMSYCYTINSFDVHLIQHIKFKTQDKVILCRFKIKIRKMFLNIQKSIKIPQSYARQKNLLHSKFQCRVSHSIAREAHLIWLISLKYLTMLYYAGYKLKQDRILLVTYQVLKYNSIMRQAIV